MNTNKLIIKLPSLAKLGERKPKPTETTYTSNERIRSFRAKKACDPEWVAEQKKKKKEENKKYKEKLKAKRKQNQSYNEECRAKQRKCTGLWRERRKLEEAASIQAKETKGKRSKAAHNKQKAKTL